ncbi:MAG: thymidylate synthase [Lentisphaeria bacterium]
MPSYDIPVLFIEDKSIAGAWEQSLIRLYEKGTDIGTMYDKREDPPSKDATMIINVKEPLSEPMIHKDFPGGLETLQEYVMEVIDGIKDHLVRDSDNENDTRWEYTYHERLFKYTVPGITESFNQIEDIARKLVETPHTRRAQAITWKVWEDPTCYDPACLQSIWCRLTTAPDETRYLNMNVRFRSNDAYKAAFMNIYALVQLQKFIAARVAELSGWEVKLGRYVHIADSYHLYGAYFEEFKERFVKGLEKRTFEERTFNSTDVQYLMDEAKPLILEKAKNMQ